MKRLSVIILSLLAAYFLCACASFTPSSVPEPEAVTYDYAALYAQVLEDLVASDPGLAGDIRYIIVDLSQAPGELSEETRTAIAQAFADAHGAECLTLSLDELIDQGYLTDLSPEQTDHKLYQWDDGVLFRIVPGGSFHDGASTADPAQFDAQMWRSPLGAYFFMNCTARWAADGSCLGYDRGAEAIS